MYTENVIKRAFAKMYELGDSPGSANENLITDRQSCTGLSVNTQQQLIIMAQRLRSNPYLIVTLHYNASGPQ